MLVRRIIYSYNKYVIYYYLCDIFDDDDGDKTKTNEIPSAGPFICSFDGGRSIPPRGCGRNRGCLIFLNTIDDDHR